MASRKGRLRWGGTGLLLAALLSYSPARAQQFEPGRLVLATGDTLVGELENRYWESNPTEVRFRVAGGGLTTYLPAQVRQFCLQSGRCFQSDVFPFDKRAETRLE